MSLTDEQIGIELRALRETPSERFAAELDAWAAEGFPSVDQLESGSGPAESKASDWRARFAVRLERLRQRPLRAALAGGAGIVLAMVVAVGVYSGIDEDRDLGDQAFLSKDAPTPNSGSVPSNAAPGDRAAESAPAAGAAGQADSSVVAPEPTTIPPEPPLPPDEQLKPGQERVQELSASMALSTEPGEVDDVADGVVEVTERFDGIVVSSNVSTSDARGRADFDLRIPSQNLRAALADLSDLADVSSRDEGVLDITAPFVTAEERFGDAKAEVDALLEQLAEADSATEIASIRQQLQFARGELAAARADLGALKQRSDFSRLSVSVVGNGDGDGWSIGDAAGDAVNILEALGGATLVTLAVLIPLAGITALGWLGLMAIRRRSREKALDRS